MIDLLVGSKVTDLQPGDKVLLSYTSCSHCGSCAANKPGACGEWDVRNFMRKRNDQIGDQAGAHVKGKPDEKIWGSFFGQSALARKAVVSRASASFRPGFWGKDLALTPQASLAVRESPRGHGSPPVCTSRLWSANRVSSASS